MSTNTTLSLQDVDTDLYSRYNVHLEDFIHLMDFTSRYDQSQQFNSALIEGRNPGQLDTSFLRVSNN